MRLMLQVSTRSQHVSRTGRVVGSSPASSSAERHQQRPLKRKKCCRCRVLKKRGAPVPLRRNVRNECGSVTNNQQPLLHPPRPRKRQKLPPQPGMRQLQRGGKIIRNERSLERQQRSFLGNGDSKFCEAKTSETNAKSSETAAGQSASAAAGSKTAAASSASAASTSAGQASASATAAGKSAESAASSASTATTKAGEATEQASAASEFCFRSEDIRNERESVGNQRRILKNGCRIVSQFGGVIGIICVCFKR